MLKERCREVDVHVVLTAFRVRRFLLDYDDTLTATARFSSY